MKVELDDVPFMICGGPFHQPRSRSEKQDQPDKLDGRIENIRHQGDDPSAANQPDHDSERYWKWVHDASNLGGDGSGEIASTDAIRVR